MKKFDVIIIGNGVSAITCASYLSKRMRSVALFLVDKGTKVEKYSRVLKDSEGHQYHFTVPYHEFGGLEKEELLSFYLNRLGIKEKFKVIPNQETVVVKRSQRILSRPNDFKGFRLYLVRHYPKSRDDIHRFFRDLQKHYENFKEQKQNFLRGEPYTITSLQAAWGTKNLKTVLTSYFNQPDLMREFGFMQHSIGLDFEDINAYFYFIRWFNVFMEKSYYIQNTYDELNKLLLPKNENLTLIQTAEFKAIEVENDEVKRLVTSKGSYEADYFCINAHPRDFINDYLKEGKGLITKRVDSMFKEKVRLFKKRIAYIGLDIDCEKIGIRKTRYMFEGASEDKVRLLNLMNYNRINLNASPKGKGALLVEFLEQPEVDLEEALIRTLKRYFKDIDKHIAVIEISDATDYAGSYDYAKDQQAMSLTKRFNFERYHYVNVWKNTFFIGSYTRPESGITGLIQMGIDIGEGIEQDLESHVRESAGITPDVLMNIVIHQYLPGVMEEPKTLVFDIAKNAYTLTLNDEVHVRRGRTDIYNAKFKTTIEGLYDIAVNCKSLDEALKNNLFELEGDVKPEVFYEAFSFGKPVKSIIYPKIKPFGSVMFYSLMIIWTVFSILAFNVPLYIAGSVLAGLHLVKLIGQTIVIRKVISLDSFLTGISLIIAVLFWLNLLPWFEIWMYWGMLGIVLLVYKLMQIDFTNMYLKYDYEAKFAYSKFFKSMMRGLSTLWVSAILIVGLGHYILQETYQSIMLYLVLIMMYLTYKYPAIYIQSMIKKGGE